MASSNASRLAERVDSMTSGAGRIEAIGRRPYEVPWTAPSAGKRGGRLTVSRAARPSSHEKALRVPHGLPRILGARIRAEARADEARDEGGVDRRYRLLRA